MIRAATHLEAPIAPPDPPSSQLRSRLRPALGLVHDLVDAVTYLVSEGHEATARRAESAIAAVPGTEGVVEAAKAVDGVRRVATEGVLRSVRVVNRGVELASSVAMDVASFGDAPEPVVPLRSDALVSMPGVLDQVVGVLNGAVGDHLARAGNGLDLGMRLRLARSESWLDLDAEGPLAVPNASSRIVVLVHGLATTELCWSLDADRALGDAEHHYGGLIEEPLGATSVYLRYNTGLSIEENGDRLSASLEQLLARWPVPVRELVLVGHSMGGLVSRSATRSATGAEHGWLSVLTDLVCLGSPHFGAPLARLGHHAERGLLAVDLPATRVLGVLLNGRSRGVKELRHREQAVGPVLPGVRYLCVAGSVGKGGNPLADWFGDALVPVDSAAGPQAENVRVVRVSGAAHHRLQAHPEVLQILLDALA